MDRSVTQSWQLITEWLAGHVPAALNCIEPPASPIEIAQVAETMGRELPGDLVEWLGLANGVVVRTAIGSIIPTLYTPLSCEGMLRRRSELLISFGEAEPQPGDDDPAGTPSQTWLAAFLPIAESASDPALLLDLREGDLHGCVGSFDIEAEGFLQHAWTSTADMLSDIAGAMVNGRPALQDHATAAKLAMPWSRPAVYAPVVEDGRLRWRPSEATDHADD